MQPSAMSTCVCSLFFMQVNLVLAVVSPASGISATALTRTFAFFARTLQLHQCCRIVVRDRRCKFCFLHSSFKKAMHHVCDRPAAALNWLCVRPSLEGFDARAGMCPVFTHTVTDRSLNCRWTNMCPPNARREMRNVQWNAI
ncbi:hypothetical protein BKA58DRAFT_391292, partial [Alternaria rosae]|uniref:uncharacterized protein n=1 Tax=Alternaria rosae TaxID=1187941 RepID=UPI001E8D8CE5